MGIHGNATGYSLVRAAEAHPIRIQETRGYAAPDGDADFLKRMVTLVFETLPFGGVQTAGVTGPHSLAAYLLAPGGVRRIRVGLPTWLNRLAVFLTDGIEGKSTDLRSRAATS